MATQEPRLLMLINDEPAQNRLVATLAARAGWRVVSFTSGEEALEMLASPESDQVHAILFDKWTDGNAPRDLIRELRDARPDTPLLALTADNSPLFAVEAMRAGATDFLVKPLGPNRLLQALDRADHSELPDAELQPLAEKLPHPVDFDATGSGED